MVARTESRESPRGIPDGANSATLAALFAMQRAGREYLENRRVLERAGLNLVSEVLRGQGEPVELEHYPRVDVFDPDTAAQYHYHAHRGMEGESGHFHAFVRTGHLPFRPRRKGVPATPCQPLGRKAIAHLVAVSMDAGLFRPQILALLWERDEAIRRRAREHPRTDVLEDRDLEVLAEIRIGVDAQLAAVDARLRKGGA